MQGICNRMLEDMYLWYLPCLSSIVIVFIGGDGITQILAKDS